MSRICRHAVLFLHATHDPQVPLRQAEHLYAACRVPKELVTVDDVPPGEPLLAASASQEAIVRFLAQYAGAPPAGPTQASDEPDAVTPATK